MILNRRKMHLLLGGAAVALVAGFPAAAEAKKKGKKGKGKDNAKGVEIPRITKKGPTYFVLNRKSYEITEDTEITIDGKEAPFGRLKVGMKASVTGRVLTYGATSRTTIYEARRVKAYTK